MARTAAFFIAAFVLLAGCGSPATVQRDASANPTVPPVVDTTATPAPQTPGESAGSTETNEANDGEPSSQANATPRPPGPPTPEELAQIEEQVIVLLNDERVARNLPPLSLGETAEVHAQEVADHLLELGELDSHAYFLANQADWYTNFSRGEILGLGSSEGLGNNWTSGPLGEVVGAWMDSDSHRRNIVNPGFDVLGVGVACNEEAQLILVVHFLGVDPDVQELYTEEVAPASPVITNRDAGPTCPPATTPR